MQAGKSAEGTEGVQLSRSNPRFMWLLRDAMLKPTDKDERPCHFKDYLLQKVSSFYIGCTRLLTVVPHDHLGDKPPVSCTARK